MYEVYYNENLIARSKLECGDPPMGVVTGVLIFSKTINKFDFLKNLLKNEDIDIDEEEKMIQTTANPSWTVLSPKGKKIEGVGTYLEGMESDGFYITILGVPYPFYEQEFPRHCKRYEEKFKEKP